MIQPSSLGAPVVRTTDRPDGEVFDRFFAGYDRAFVLPDEKEDREGLEACLAQNHGAAYDDLAARFGAFRELCLIAEDEHGAPLGGANFIAMPSGSAQAGLVTANLNYIYVDQAARGRGNLRRLLQAVRESAAALFGDGGRLEPLVFIEQNDPFRMSDDAYARDTEFTGLDQLDRLRIWGRLGAKVVDFPYVQPALSDEQGADDGLIYSVLGSAEDSLDPAVLHTHLSRFFGISVLKGRSLESDEAVAAQMESLGTMIAAGGRIPLRDPGPLLARLRNPAEASALLGLEPESFRQAAALYPPELVPPPA